jgi:hypothetical protein
MRDLKNKLTSGKNSKNIHNRKGKSFGYQVLGFGAGGAAASPYVADFMILAGGGGGGGCGTHGNGAGGGGGGMISSYCNACAAGLEFSPGTPYAVTIGAGGTNSNTVCNTNGADASVVYDCGTRTSTGGGKGQQSSPSPHSVPSRSGGSGGGGGNPGGCAFGVGNTPPVSAADGGPQGNPGGPFASNSTGGGGASAAGAPGNASAGGAGRVTCITGSPLQFGGGGGGGSFISPWPGGAGGAHGS